MPADHRNVAKYFVSTGGIHPHVMIPDALEHRHRTAHVDGQCGWGSRVEALFGGVGIGLHMGGYNASNLSGVTAAIVLIGVVGLTLDAVFMKFSRMVAVES